MLLDQRGRARRTTTTPRRVSKNAAAASAPIAAYISSRPVCVFVVLATVSVTQSVRPFPFPPLVTADGAEVGITIWGVVSADWRATPA